MRLLSKRSAGIAAIFLLVLMVFVFFIPVIIERKISDGVSENCDSCSFSAKNISLKMSPFSIIMKSVYFHGGNEDATAVDADIDQIELPIQFSEIFKKNFILGIITIRGVQVTVTEGDIKNSPSTESDDTQNSTWHYSVQEVLIHDCIFHYTRNYRSRSAHLLASNISGTIQSFGTTQEFISKKALAEATGRLEKSGSFHLAVNSAIHSKKIDLGVHLQIQNQNLHDLSAFFEARGQIKMKGDLVEGKSNIQIRDKKLSGWVFTRYKDLGIIFEKNQTRSPSATFFANLLQSFKIHSSDLSSRPENQIRSIVLDRENGESIISFILHGMKNAVLHVASDS